MITPVLGIENGSTCRRSDMRFPFHFEKPRLQGRLGFKRCCFHLCNFGEEPLSGLLFEPGTLTKQKLPSVVPHFPPCVLIAFQRYTGCMLGRRITLDRRERRTHFLQVLSSTLCCTVGFKWIFYLGIASDIHLPPCIRAQAPQSGASQKQFPEGLGSRQLSPTVPDMWEPAVCNSVHTHGMGAGWLASMGEKQPLDTRNTGLHCQRRPHPKWG